MKLDINEINHQHITKVVIFAVFLYKRQIKQASAYKLSVLKFVKARIPWNINLVIKTPERLPKDEEREIILDQILNNIETDYLSKVEVEFTTPLKKMSMEIDLKDEKKYEKFLYK